MTTAILDSPGRDLVGKVIAERYRVCRLLGEGGIGAVYLAEHTLMKKSVALKVLRPEMATNEEALARFRREAEAAAQLAHPNLVAATDFGQTDDGAFFLVLEYVDGRTLRQALAEAPFAPRRALRIARQVALALECAHHRGIIHRDLKPENVMLLPKDEVDDFVKVLDFGIARVESPAGGGAGEQPLTRLGTVIGTPDYMAPEQALGERAGPATDLYALGVVLYEMITGRHPFDGDAMAMLSMHMVAPVPAMVERAPGVAVLPSTEAIVRRLLEKAPGDRHPSARALVEAIDEELTSRGEIARAAVTREAPPPVAAGRLPRRTLVAGAVLGVLGLVSIVLVAGRSSPDGRATATPAGLTAAPRATAAAAPAEAVRAAAARGPAALEELAQRFPEDPAVLRELAFAYDGANRPSDALRAIRRAADAKALPLPRDLVRVVMRATSGFETSDEAFALLEGPFGADGVDALLELSASKEAPAATSARASKSLVKPLVRANASPGTAFLIDLRAASSCEAKRAVLVRSGNDADARAREALAALSKPYGCGRRGKHDCYPCLRGDGSLGRALRASDAAAAR